MNLIRLNCLKVYHSKRLTICRQRQIQDFKISEVLEAESPRLVDLNSSKWSLTMQSVQSSERFETKPGLKDSSKLNDLLGL